MITYTTTRAELLFVDVPEGAHQFMILKNWGKPNDNRLSFQLGSQIRVITLPPGEWTLHPEVTEEVARELVDRVLPRGQFTPEAFWDYSDTPPQYYMSTALESLQSLRTKLNINPSAVLLSKPLNNK